MNPRFWNVVLLSGISVGIIGCFLPWGSLNYPNYPWSFWLAITAGNGIPSGLVTFECLFFALILQLLFMAKRNMFIFLAMLITTLFALSISAAWIHNPIAEFSYGGYYTVLYGAYVTQLSTIAVSATAFLYLALTAEEQLNLNKQYQITHSFRVPTQLTPRTRKKTL